MNSLKADLEPFDGDDPFNRVADRLRKEIAGIAQQVIRTSDYKHLTPAEQIESVATGMMTGLLGVLFAHVEDGGHDAIVQWLIDYLPQARLQAEGIFENAMRKRN